MYLLYITYYTLPLVFMIPVLLIWKKKSIMRGTSDFSKGREYESSKVLKSKKKDIKIFQVTLILLILLFMPLAHYSSSTLSDGLMDRHRVPQGSGSYIDKPVEHQIGPSSDTDAVIKEMEDEKYYWHDWVVEGIKDEIDFDEITRLPGRLGVYYLERSSGVIGGKGGIGGTFEHNVVITYSYFSPIPITKVYGFFVMPEQENIFLREGPNTVIYPMDPADADPL